VLNDLPEAVQPKAKQALREIWMAENQASAHEAFAHFVQMYQAKYPKAVAFLEKDREALLTFYDFPAEHRVHIRTTNPIESAFATIRHERREALAPDPWIQPSRQGQRGSKVQRGSRGQRRRNPNHQGCRPIRLYTRFDYSPSSPARLQRWKPRLLVPPRGRFSRPAL